MAKCEFNGVKQMRIRVDLLIVLKGCAHFRKRGNKDKRSQIAPLISGTIRRKLQNDCDVIGEFRAGLESNARVCGLQPGHEIGPLKTLLAEEMNADIRNARRREIEGAGVQLGALVRRQRIKLTEKNPKRRRGVIRQSGQNFANDHVAARRPCFPVILEEPRHDRPN